ncbi:MAG TPA: Uma2 family endonuclease [Methylomirabilota bacterium]|jgi:Uma2 family endonuclease|nr:Uma2 family endonuclease [Methylomirabilota bacterium]
MATPVVRHLFTVGEYHRMGEAGIFTEDDRVELIEGEIVEMTPVGSLHAAFVDRLTDLLTSRIGRRAIVRVQSPIGIGPRSEPQPDVTVLRRREDFYAHAHPEPPDVLLVIEVADTSLEFDRAVKAPLYSRLGIPEMWILDVAGPSLEIHRRHSAEGYRDVRTARRGERLTPTAFPDLNLSVDDILG